MSAQPTLQPHRALEFRLRAPVPTPYEQWRVALERLPELTAEQVVHLPSLVLQIEDELIRKQALIEAQNMVVALCDHALPCEHTSVLFALAQLAGEYLEDRGERFLRGLASLGTRGDYPEVVLRAKLDLAHLFMERGDRAEVGAMLAEAASLVEQRELGADAHVMLARSYAQFAPQLEDPQIYLAAKAHYERLFDLLDPQYGEPSEFAQWLSLQCAYVGLVHCFEGAEIALQRLGVAERVAMAEVSVSGERGRLLLLKGTLLVELADERNGDVQRLNAALEAFTHAHTHFIVEASNGGDQTVADTPYEQYLYRASVLIADAHERLAAELRSSQPDAADGHLRSAVAVYDLLLDWVGSPRAVGYGYEVAAEVARRRAAIATRIEA